MGTVRGCGDWSFFVMFVREKFDVDYFDTQEVDSFIPIHISDQARPLSGSENMFNLSTYLRSWSINMFTCGFMIIHTKIKQFEIKRIEMLFFTWNGKKPLGCFHGMGYWSAISASHDFLWFSCFGPLFIPAHITPEMHLWCYHITPELLLNKLGC